MKRSQKLQHKQKQEVKKSDSHSVSPDRVIEKHRMGEGNLPPNQIRGNSLKNHSCQAAPAVYAVTMTACECHCCNFRKAPAISRYLLLTTPNQAKYCSFVYLFVCHIVAEARVQAHRSNSEWQSCNNISPPKLTWADHSESQ